MEIFSPTAVGKYLLKMGAVLDTEDKKAMGKHSELAPDIRLQMVREESVGKFNRLEDQLRKDLVKFALFAENDLPTAMYPMATATVHPAPSQVTLLSTKDELSTGSDAPGETKKPSAILGEAEVLTVEHVHERLGVKGCGEMVLVAAEALSHTATTIDTAIKRENKDDTTDLVDVTADSSPGSQPSKVGDDMSSWREGKLVNVSLPHAVIEVCDGDDIRKVTVSVDSLRAVPKVNTKNKVILHPSLREMGTPLRAYDYGSLERAISQGVADHMLMWANVAALPCVESLTVSMLSEADKLPFILQVRATTAFKKGDLVLAPASGLFAGPEDPMHKVKGLLHASMLPKVELNVFMGKQDGRKKKKEDPRLRTTTFDLFSPLYGGKNTKSRELVLENLPPFWSVLRCVGTRAIHNMEMETVVFTDPGFILKGGIYPKLPKSCEYAVEIPVLRNSLDIAAGDVLCLPVYDM